MAVFTLARRRAGICATLLSLIVGVGALPGGSAVPVARAADPSSDIPGAPLPGPVAAGRLGGTIYDVVYSLNVPPGHVVVASVTGTAGTDFDMYLFDATATTVLSNVGLLAKSTGPTSTESISWPSQFGGTYYIDLNGATDVEGDFRLTVQTIPDPTPPTLAIALANGRPSTNEVTVSVSLDAFDDLSGLADMAFSSDGQTFDAWQPFQPSTTWTFPPGDGQRALWAKVRNGVGFESAVAGASLVIDTVPPSVIAVDPEPTSSVVGLRPKLSVTFDEPIDRASMLDLGLVVQSANGALVDGTYAYDNTARIGSFVPASNLNPGHVYVVTVGDVTDVAGNRVVSPGSWTFTPLSTTGLKATANPGVIAYGGSARVNVSLTGAPLPATLDVLNAIGGAGFVPSTTIATEDGTNTLVTKPPSNTTFRFRYNGAFGVAPSHVDVRILVRRAAILAGRDQSVVARGRVGRPVTLTAAIAPATAGVTVSFRLYRFDAGSRKWIYAGSRGRSTTATGRATYSWIPPSSGQFYWRVAVAPTPEFANNTSPVYRWSISR